MRKQVNAYKAYVVHLEAELEKYRREYANSPGRAFGVGGEPVVSFPYHHLRPQSVDFDGETDNDDDFYEELEETDPPSPGDPVDQICGATQTLKVTFYDDVKWFKWINTPPPPLFLLSSGFFH